MLRAASGEPVGAVTLRCGAGGRDLRGLLLAFGFALAVASAAVLLLFTVRQAHGAASLPAGFVQSRVAGGLTDPTTMTFAPDGRIFVAEQAGKLRIIRDGQLLGTPFLDISHKVDSAGERGLLGVAFDPEFSTNKYVYVYYTRKATSTTPAHNRVVRFTASNNTAVLGSEKHILRLNNLSSAQNHNGGAIHFGEDDKLYVAVGENAEPENSQLLDNLLGKMLRINADGTIPTDNPFYDIASGKNRAIWALGLRNPFSFAVQPGTGRIFINDVGSNERFRPTPYEEINRGMSGANYGWPENEGPQSDPDFQGPIYAYPHDNPEAGYAITGGAFYNPATHRFPAAYAGDYFFADAPQGWIRRYDLATDRAVGFATDVPGPVDLDVGTGGNLHVLARGSGSVERIRYTGS
jgi:glucose/arabinose dehydrogenase